MIDTVHAEAPAVSCIRGGRVIARIPIAHDALRTGGLLRALRALERRCGALDRAGAIAVVPGPGTFSSVRHGVVTANALAWALCLPLQVRGRRVHTAVPEYGAPPNMTMPARA